MSGGRHSGTAGGTIRRRLARILALPAVVVLLLFAVLATGQIRDYQDSLGTARAVDLALAVQDLAHELQNERGVTAAVLGGNDGLAGELPGARQRVDRRKDALQRQVSGGGDVESQVRSALSQLDGIGAVRSATGAGRTARAATARAETLSYYTDRIAALISVDLGLERVADEQLRQAVTALTALQEMIEATAQERVHLNGVFSAGGFTEGEFAQFAAMRTERQTAATRFTRAARPQQQESLENVLSSGAARQAEHFEQVALAAADGRPVVVNPQSWWSGLTTVLDDMRQLQQHIGSQIQLRAHDLQTGSTQRLALLVGAVLACLAGWIHLAVQASRSISRPLAHLVAEAESVVLDRLPAAVNGVQTGRGDDPPEPLAPVDVPARAAQEIHSVAASLDRLQTAAYNLAVEQTGQRRRTVESLANLGRRNQNLIRRQLGFITSLEREEADPQVLAQLFELDHLATRMRRNAASLLVLVGSASHQRWSEPVPVADVIRAAVCEVEEYRRVGLRRVDLALICGASVGAVAHLLSELIENSLSFSPPDTEVEVQGRQLPDGYLVAVTDQGVGMRADDLAAANSRLRGEGDFIAAPTRYLGHYVVGEIARQLSITVELVPSPVVGVTARVTLPADLLGFHAAVAGPAASDQPAEPEAAIERASRPPHGGSATLQPQRAHRDEPPQPPRTIPAAASLFEPVAHQQVPRGDTPPAAVGPLHPEDGETAADGSGAPTPGRTRNGLTRRLPREARPVGAVRSSIEHHTDATAPEPSTGCRVIDLDAAVWPATMVDPAPEQVSARLTALRAGVTRGRAAGIILPADCTEEESP